MMTNKKLAVTVVNNISTHTAQIIEEIGKNSTEEQTMALGEVYKTFYKVGVEEGFKSGMIYGAAFIIGGAVGTAAVWSLIKKSKETKEEQ